MHAHHPISATWCVPRDARHVMHDTCRSEEDEARKKKREKIEAALHPAAATRAKGRCRRCNARCKASALRSSASSPAPRIDVVLVSEKDSGAENGTESIEGAAGVG
eukprot:2461069-Rhodomonas_salina.1